MYRQWIYHFLIFRIPQLAACLQDPDVQHILKANGYEDLSLGGILRTFQCRYGTYMNHGEGFPHEIGLLLGYPIEDVTGFIEQRGKIICIPVTGKCIEMLQQRKESLHNMKMPKKN